MSKKNKKIVCIVPIKQNSKRVKGKNFKKLGKLPLYEHLFKKLKKTNFDEIYIDSDSEEIEKITSKYGFKFIKRLKDLSKDSANGNDLLLYHAKKIPNADLYFQIFVTSPLLKISTINACIEKLDNSKKYDSILTATKIHSWFWFNGKPVNYNPNVLPRSQNAKPIIRETTALYGITKKALIKEKCRIGKSPLFFFVDAIEAIDIDENIDFKIVNSLIN
jgi:CMP-N-acetylneuraminic acid synthetase